MKNLSIFLSWLFVPLVVPIYGLLLVLYLPVKSASYISINSLYLYNPTAKILFLSLFTVFLLLAPTISFLVLKKNKTISSIQMEKREERYTPLAIMTFYCCILLGFLYFQSKSILIPPILEGVALGGGIASILAFFITKKHKVSFHSIAMGALLGFFYMYARTLTNEPVFVLSAVILLGGVINYTRVYLKKHTLFEVGIGYFLGFGSLALGIYIMHIISFLIYINK